MLMAVRTELIYYAKEKDEIYISIDISREIIWGGGGYKINKPLSGLLVYRMPKVEKIVRKMNSWPRS